MSKDTDRNFFIVSPLWAQFYQQLISTSEGFRELGTRLIRHAERAYIFREVESVEEAAKLLINFPIREYQLVGQYYLGWCEYVRGSDVKSTFERIAEYGPLHYRARAMHTLAALAAREKDSASELGWIIESMKASPSLEGFRGMAILKAREGFHNSSMKDLESCMPFARYADPLSYYDFLNSYAVELGEAGRLEEARNISHIVLRSPFAYAYPEWQDTANDLRGSQKSFVSINSFQCIPRNVFLMPVPKHGEIATRLDKPARVLDLQKWKSKMSNGNNGNDEQKPVEKMNTSEMLLRAMQVFSDRSISEEKRREMLKAIERILAEPSKPEPDKPDDEHGA